MWFKNLVVYRLPANWAVEADALEIKLSRQPLQPCGSFDMESRGWTCPRDDGRVLYTLNRQWLLSFGVEQKLLPASVIRQVTQERAAEIAKQQAHSIGRKQMRELKEQVTSELLPRALSRRTATWAWIDPVNGWLVVDAAGDTKAEQLLETLLKAEDSLPVKRLETQRSPAAAMTQWLANRDPPTEFTIDQDLELRSADEGKATVRYVRHALEGKEIRDHIMGGKSATRLGMTWKDRISFVLTEDLHIKRLAFLDILKQEPGAETEDESELFDIEFALMTGELALFLADLVAVLGGEKAQVQAGSQADHDHRSTPA